jgi:RNA polymerase sigma-70 factor (ECF subfamily)
VPDSTDVIALITSLDRRLFATVWRVLRHAQDAEDALQNALTTIWQKRAAIESHPAPQALILRICADAAVDQLRRRRNLNGQGELEDSIPTNATGPAECAIERETSELLMSSIARLSPNQATAILMRFIQEEPFESIAAALGCSTTTAREHVARGRERLSQLLAHMRQVTAHPS